MRALIPRPRLVAALASRHELTLSALVAPAGFGRTVLLDQASAALGPEARDIRYECAPDDARPGALAMRLSALLAVASGAELDTSGADDISGSVERLATGLVACDRQLPTALCLDRFEVTGAAGTELLLHLVADAPPGVHLVVSARDLGPVGLGRLVVAGRGRLFGWRDLAFDADERTVFDLAGEPTSTAGDEAALWPALAVLREMGNPELVIEYVQHEVLAAQPEPVVRALAALAAVGGCASDDLHEVTAPVLEGLAPSIRDDTLDRVAELPLMGRVSVGCWPHPVWIRATWSVLDEEDRRRVIDKRIAAQLDRGDVSEAGRMAMEAASQGALCRVVRAALASAPVSVSFIDLRAWQRAELLDTEIPERRWLDAIIGSRDDDESMQFQRLEEVRTAFEDRGDLDGETSVLLQLGNLARARGDAGALLGLLTRAQVLAARGDQRAASLVALGQAVSAQLAGRPGDAIRAVDSVSPGVLPADWAAQALMIRGTNLLLDGRIDAAIACLEAATGEGSVGSLATAHDLLSTARWQAGDSSGALDDAAVSVSLAAGTGSPARVQLSRFLVGLPARRHRAGQRDADAARAGPQRWPGTFVRGCRVGGRGRDLAPHR